MCENFFMLKYNGLIYNQFFYVMIYMYDFKIGKGFVKVRLVLIKSVEL